ncbi:MAG: hypothetical protein KAG95_04875 [Bacteroidales bacterium]|nr:hypothetical protein [Bacteroidales bacterium]
MLRIKKILNFSFLVILIFQSCSPAYTPNVLNTPLLSNKGEFQAGIGTGISGVDPQFAYAITENIGIMLNGSFCNRKSSESSSSNYYHNHNFVETAAGYYTKVSRNGRFSIFSGYGLGNVDAEYKSNLVSSQNNATIYRYFIQPDFGFTTTVFDGSIASRIVLVDVNKDGHSFSAYAEPALTGRLGYKNFKFYLQAGLAIPLTKSDNYDFQPLIFSLGINYKFRSIK